MVAVLVLEAGMIPMIHDVADGHINSCIIYAPFDRAGLVSIPSQTSKELMYQTESFSSKPI